MDFESTTQSATNPNLSTPFQIGEADKKGELRPVYGSALGTIYVENLEALWDFSLENHDFSFETLVKECLIVGVSKATSKGKSRAGQNMLFQHIVYLHKFNKDAENVALLLAFMHSHFTGNLERETKRGNMGTAKIIRRKVDALEQMCLGKYDFAEQPGKKATGIRAKVNAADLLAKLRGLDTDAGDTDSDDTGDNTGTDSDDATPANVQKSAARAALEAALEAIPKSSKAARRAIEEQIADLDS